MFKRIMVPVDLTAKNLKAANIAIRLADPEQAETVLVHVIEVIEGLPTEELKSFYAQLEVAARRKMKGLSARFTRKGLNCQVVISFGNRLNEILRCAQKYKIDLIVLSSHRVDPQHPGRDWGTISHKVSVLASCPVLLVK